MAQESSASVLDEQLPDNTSNLSPELQAKVRTTEFKAWFGDWEHNPAEASKIIDENGEPQVVFVGAPAGITTFSSDKRGRTGADEIGFYSSRRYRDARFYAQTTHDPVTDIPAPSSVYGVFLNMRQPHQLQPGEQARSQRVTEVPQDYDGYINDEAQELVVFDPMQILIVSEEQVNQ